MKFGARDNQEIYARALSLSKFLRSCSPKNLALVFKIANFLKNCRKLVL
jgi:hypothetical protein